MTDPQCHVGGRRAVTLQGLCRGRGWVFSMLPSEPSAIVNTVLTHSSRRERTRPGRAMEPLKGRGVRQAAPVHTSAMTAQPAFGRIAGPPCTSVYSSVKCDGEACLRGCAETPAQFACKFPPGRPLCKHLAPMPRSCNRPASASDHRSSQAPAGEVRVYPQIPVPGFRASQ